MCYKNYERDIVTKHKAELIGWPATIKFANPSEIGTVQEIRKLRQTLKVGECKWIVQSRRQQAAYAEKLAAKEATGGLVVKKRKERSDKGKTRGSLKGKKKAFASTSGTRDDQVGGPGGSEDDEDDEEPRQPAKKKRKRMPATKARAEKKLPPAPKSRAFIPDTDDEDDE
jgi:hypothetical protein